jgi:hypothetical protein
MRPFLVDCPANPLAFEGRCIPTGIVALPATRGALLISSANNRGVSPPHPQSRALARRGGSAFPVGQAVFETVHQDRISFPANRRRRDGCAGAGGIVRPHVPKFTRNPPRMSNDKIFQGVIGSDSLFPPPFREHPGEFCRFRRRLKILLSKRSRRRKITKTFRIKRWLA